jgi:hypothetical protein
VRSPAITASPGSGCRPFAQATARAPHIRPHVCMLRSPGSPSGLLGVKPAVATTLDRNGVLERTGPTTSTAMSTEPYRCRTPRPPARPALNRLDLSILGNLGHDDVASLYDTQVSILLCTHDNCGATSMRQDVSADRPKQHSGEAAVTSVTHN